MLADPRERLRHAIISGNLLIVKRLLRRFPHLLYNNDPKNGWSSLHYASYHGHYLICLHLIQLGHEKVELSKTYKGNTCVHLSLIQGQEQTAHLLLQYFPNLINVPNNDGMLPIHIVCMHNYVQCLRLLVNVTTDINVKDRNDNTPIRICLEYNSLQCLELLLDRCQDQDKNIIDNIDVAMTFDLAKKYKSMVRRDKKSTMNIYKTPNLDKNEPTFNNEFGVPSPILNSVVASPPAKHSLFKISTSIINNGVSPIKSPKLDIPTFTRTNRRSN
ncbi:hypothetical protein KAFR_0C03980 [Kazachstania africana CBS 2517]|uniref:Uncharacterized protein n=1 Tax=Kazachstania africana (strain ATCC 22294 / BCRC 22015 / CBS 2517 / CECT 1963 / NBRC 1671 / NRRL Y-8276) TaxID=1071382 RepID=H2ASN9_KAZAF|nr:hypothetical protein KAFR_0C03980 [Kazachstania africana CBS 2517]CCF57389.1 hypothetical protein KAFR_0C03980 [Kazachstania africana CBS 2517]